MIDIYGLAIIHIIDRRHGNCRERNAGFRSGRARGAVRLPARLLTAWRGGLRRLIRRVRAIAPDGGGSPP